MRVKKSLVKTANRQPDSAHPTGLPIGPKVCFACRGCRACWARRARQLPTGQLMDFSTNMARPLVPAGKRAPGHRAIGPIGERAPSGPSGKHSHLSARKGAHRETNTIGPTPQSIWKCGPSVFYNPSGHGPNRDHQASHLIWTLAESAKQN